jgi:HAD superfamily hydrolase (TIGR01662 family)
VSAALRMKKPIRLVIFDLGSTLIYEKDNWDPFFPRADEALWEELRGAGVTIEPAELYNGLTSLFSVYYEQHRGDLNEPTTIGVLDKLLQDRGLRLQRESLRSAVGAMFAVTQENWLPEQDAISTLASLRQNGFRIGLISNASDDDNTQALIDKGRLRPYLEHIVSSAAFGKRKPHPDIFASVLQHFEIPAAQAVMVGDDYEADILGANGVGMQSIWITRRAYDKTPDMSRGAPTAVVSSLSEIPNLLTDA